MRMTPPPCKCTHLEQIIVWVRGHREPEKQRHDRHAPQRPRSGGGFAYPAYGNPRTPKGGNTRSVRMYERPVGSTR